MHAGHFSVATHHVSPPTTAKTVPSSQLKDIKSFKLVDVSSKFSIINRCTHNDCITHATTIP